MADVHLSIVPAVLTGRKVLAALLGVFAVVLAVNGTFAYFAISTWPGYAQNDAYERGLRYNDVLEEARRQKALGWTSNISAERDGLVRVRLTGQGNVPVNLRSVSVTLSRFLGDPKEMILALSVDAEGGFFGRSAPLAPGLWSAVIQAEDASGRKFRMQHSIEVRP
jgi:nitrogen fixation protein FixH